MAEQRPRRGKIHVNTRAKWHELLSKLPEGYEGLGVVQQGSLTPGVLARNKQTGEFVQVSETHVQTLDQKKVKAAMESSRPVGRPRTHYEVLEPVMVRMGPTLKAFFEKMGDGEVSTGVRRVGEEARQRSLRTKESESSS
jgi:hypothetical protein